MKVNTTRFGEIDVPEESVLYMKEGMLGFAGDQRFTLLEDRSDTPFKWFQCIDEPGLAFVVVDPANFFSDYEIELSDEDAYAIGAKNESDAVLITIVTIDNKSGFITTNLLGPVVINFNTRLAKQIVVQDDKYQTKHLIGRRICSDVSMENAVAA